MRISWQTAMIVAIAMLVIGAIILVGPLVGLDSETLRWAGGIVAVIGLGAAGLSPALIDKQKDEKEPPS